VVFTSVVFTYLYKYLHKGLEHTWYSIGKHNNGVVDEIKDYVNGRYLCSTEAAWRIVGFDTTSKEPSVSCLPIHLPGQNFPKFQALTDITTTDGTSLLMRYFNRPANSIFNNIKYEQYYQSYVLYKLTSHYQLKADEYIEKEIPNVPPKLVRGRKKAEKVTRVVTVKPSTGELFYLWALLLHKPGRSFHDMWTVDSIIYHMFQEVAYHLGLFSNDNEGFFAMTEAVECYCTPAQLRFLFASIVLERYLAQLLWEHFCEPLSTDYIQNTKSMQKGVDHTLESLARYLQDAGHRLTNFSLPEPDNHSPEVISELEYFNEQRMQL
jgi:hypothetical protein